MQDFRKLKVWEKSHRLAIEVYTATRGFPREELYGLSSQMRRSAASIPTNIAEGCGRLGSREFLQFLNIAFGSASELQYQLILVSELAYIGKDDFERLSSNTTEVKRMLSALVGQAKTEN